MRAAIVMGVISNSASIASAQAVGGRTYSGMFGGASNDPTKMRTVDLSLTASEAYDNNNYETLAGGTGVTIPSNGVYSSFDGALSANVGFRHVRLTGSGGANVRYQQSDSGWTGVSQYAAAGVSGDLGPRTQFAVTQSASFVPPYLYGLVPIAMVPLGESVGSVVGGSSDQSVGSENSYLLATTVALSRTLGARRSLQFDGEYRDGNFSDSGASRNKVTSYGVSTRYTQGLTKNMGLRLGYAYRSAQFGTSATGEQVGLHYIDSGIDYLRSLSLSKRTKLSFSVGSTVINEPAQGGGSGSVEFRMLGNVTLQRDIGRTWRALLIYDRTAGISEAFRQPVQSDAVRLTTNGLISRRVDVSAEAWYSSTDVRAQDNPDRFGSYQLSGRARVALGSSWALSLQSFYYTYSNLRPVDLVVSGLPPTLDRYSVRLGLCTGSGYWKGKFIVLPGQEFTPREILRILWRRKWVIGVPSVVIAVATFLYGRQLPKLYQSETVIMVVPQRIPETYVRSTVTNRIEDRLASISPQILSRPKLEAIIQELNLYPRQRQTLVMDQVIATMRDAINVRVDRGETFRVNYLNPDPVLAQEVTRRLAALFIDENLRDREVQAEGTNQFLDSQLEEARQRLVEHERKLEQYKQRFSGQLPAQVQVNLQTMQSAEMQSQSLAEAMSRDRERRMLLERQLSDAQSFDSSVDVVPSRPGQPQVSSNAQLLAAAEAELRDLESKYKPEHPDVVAAKRTIRDLQAKVAAEAAARASVPAGAAPLPTRSAEVIRENRIRDIKNDLQNIDAQMTRNQAKEVELRQTINEYRSRVEAAPARESEMTELMRDYSTLQSAYTGLLAKRQDSKIAANLEKNQVSAQFKILDPANLPQRPFSPDLLRLNMMGVFLGVALSLGLAGLLEYLDATFKNEDDVVRVLQLPVLALVPVMISDVERRLMRRRQAVVGIAAVIAVTAFVVMAWWRLKIT